MVNNKKKSKQTAKAKRADPAQTATAATAPKTPPKPSTPGVFSRSQFCILMLLCVAVSRLMIVRGAVSAGAASSAGSDSDDDASFAASKTCVDYLGETACQQEAISQLLHYKFHTGVQATVIVVAAMLQCWLTENILEAFCSMFILSPMALGLLLLEATNAFMARKGLVVKEGMVCTVLLLLALPSDKANFPFFGSAAGKRYRPKTLQSLCLMSLVAMNLVQGGQLLAKALPSPLTWSAPWSWEDSAATLVQAPITTQAVIPILAFILLDLFTMTLVHSFAWYYFPEQQQRTYLLHVAVIKMVEYLYQLPILNDMLVDGEARGMVVMSVAVFCGFGWIAPSLSWKKKLA